MSSKVFWLCKDLSFKDGRQNQEWKISSHSSALSWEQRLEWEGVNEQPQSETVELLHRHKQRNSSTAARTQTAKQFNCCTDTNSETVHNLEVVHRQMQTELQSECSHSTTYISPMHNAYIVQLDAQSTNIARGTTDPEIDSVIWTKFSDHMVPLALVSYLTTRWRRLQLLENLATRWHHLH